MPRALRRGLAAGLAVLFFLLSACAGGRVDLPHTPGGEAASAVEAAPGTKEEIGLFLGVKDYGRTETVNKANAASFLYRFFIGGEERTFPIPVDGSYTLQNRLMEGYFYRLTVEDGAVRGLTLLSDGDPRLLAGPLRNVDGETVEVSRTRLTRPEQCFSYSRDPGGVTVAPALPEAGQYAEVLYGENGSPEAMFLSQKPAAYRPPVKGKPEVKTVKNLLSTALAPVGVCVYMFGGGWDWQDEAAGPQSKAFGLQQTWVDFFFETDENYTYRDPEGDETKRDKTKSYCPFGEYNEYYYAGLDCAGYLGWIAYNLFPNEDGYVFGGTATAKSFASQGWGSFTQDFTKDDLLPGDVVSINGHVWLLVGKCADGSLIIAHASPTKSVTGNPGGGVQLSAIGPDESCRAYTLLNEYVNLFYPAWASRYEIHLFSYDYYTTFTGEEAGRFSWDVPGILSDPEGIREMDAEDILALLFDYRAEEPSTAGEVTE